jgi:hypothetical protein
MPDDLIICGPEEVELHIYAHENECYLWKIYNGGFVPPQLEMERAFCR